MFQLNVPKKTSALIQVWASVLLIVVAVIMSFTPIITLKTSDNADAINEMMAEISDEPIEIPEKVGVTAPSLISSTKLMIDVISTLSNTNSENAQSNEKLEALEERLKSEEGQKAMVTAMALANTLMGVFGDDADDADGESTSSSSSTGGALEIVFNIMIVMSVVLGVLGLTMVLPVIFIIIALTALIPALTKMKTPEVVAGKIGGKLTGVLTLPLMLMIFQCVIPGMSYGLGTIAIMVIAILSVLLSTVLSRCIKYNEKQFMYINLTQGASILGIVGFLVFFFNLLKTNIFSSFMNGGIFAYIGRITDLKKSAKYASLTIETPSDFYVDIILMVVYVIFVLSAIAYLEKAARRLSCTSKNGDNFLAYAIMTLPVFVLPTIVKGMKHNYDITLDFTEGLVIDKANAESFLKLSDKSETALVLVLVGIIIMIAAEVALIVLKKVFCKDMTDLEMKAVVSGEVLAVEDASATEAVTAEEVTAEETPAEETVAEVEEETTSQN